MPEFTVLHQMLSAMVRDRIERFRASGDEGNVENIIWIALGAALAVAVLGIITAKVMAKANSIELG
ncbi:hypothetical protein AB0368_06620 [Actinoplanes sp. NPDC051475]|uniref:hypothetical protein n=1 Tax=Actinoplanes sp. NPDC051475 TaxID=3157225 RepID=UPI00344FEFE7